MKERSSVIDTLEKIAFMTISTVTPVVVGFYHGRGELFTDNVAKDLGFGFGMIQALPLKDTIQTSLMSEEDFQKKKNEVLDQYSLLSPRVLELVIESKRNMSIGNHLGYLFSSSIFYFNGYCFGVLSSYLT